MNPILRFFLIVVSFGFIVWILWGNGLIVLGLVPVPHMGDDLRVVHSGWVLMKATAGALLIPAVVLVGVCWTLVRNLFTA